MKVVRRGPNKLWIFVGGRAFVLRLDKEIQLVPRWRIAGCYGFSAFAAGASAVAGHPWLAGGMFALAVFFGWAMSR